MGQVCIFSLGSGRKKMVSTVGPAVGTLEGVSDSCTNIFFPGSGTAVVLGD